MIQEYQVSGFRVREYEELRSTNTEAERVGWNELEDKMVILTYRQTQGRGQVGNHWESEPGKNISMTVVFKPRELPAGQQFAVSMVIALGACDFISRYVNGCSVKWPNDIYVGDRKISGILIEHSIIVWHRGEHQPRAFFVGCPESGFPVSADRGENSRGTGVGGVAGLYWTALRIDTGLRGVGT